ncbi:MAG: permease-like cell division protein FtsX [Lachnospiraceae bacterium]|nr:permease-like cell division protein FtsX [Lachnospiraceae bacterium]
MRISSLGYTIKEGFVSLFRNKWYTLASVATISACLFLLGAFAAIMLNLQYIVNNVQREISVTVFFQSGTTEEEMLALRDQLILKDEVDHVDYTSADEAWESFAEELGVTDYLDGFVDNPLADSASLTIYMSDVTMQSELVDYLESWDIVRRVNKSELAATTLGSLNSLVGIASVGIIGILFLVSVFLISNTITIGISIRKEEINIMKYIGATDFFVRFPFIIEGMLIGLIGTAIPLTALYFVYNNVIIAIVTRFSSLSSLLGFLDVMDVFQILVPLSVAIGVGIGFLGSVFTCRKHLRV